MKNRSDFVSNSSSSSFIIHENAGQAVSCFLHDFGDVLKHGGTLFDELDCWFHFIDGTGKLTECNLKDFVNIILDGDLAYDTITDIEFSTEDSYTLCQFVVASIRKYFDDHGFNTDASETERPCYLSDENVFEIEVMKKVFGGDKQ